MPRSILTTMFCSALVLGACTDDGQSNGDTTTGASTTDAVGSSSTEGSTGATPGSTTSSGDDGSTTLDADSGSGDSTGGGEVELEVIVAFDPAAFELPEGLLVDGGEAIVGFALTGAIERIALADGVRSPLAQTPPPPANTSFVTGIDRDAEGRVLAAVVSFTADLAPGIYRAPAAGGDAVLWASDPALVFPNGFAWGDDGTLFVTDSAYGGVMTVDADGVVAPWVQDPLLAGDASNCGGTSSIAVGANGIVRDGDSLLVAGNDTGVLVRVPIADDGSAGEIEVVAGPDCELAGIDGIALDDDGTVVAAINRADRLVRIATDGSHTVVAEGAPLDFPATPVFTDAGDLVVTSFALGQLLAGGDPHPALVRVHLP